MSVEITCAGDSEMQIKQSRVLLRVTVAVVLLAAYLIPALFIKSHSTDAAQKTGVTPLKAPPADQTFIGAKQCSSCHFDQYLKWRQTKHAKGFDILPAKYRADASCLKCHTTGFGEPTGYQGAKTPDLVGTSCEACHGPGSKHAEIAKGFGTKKLSKEEEAYVRSTTHKILPGNACVECHVAQSHQEHPPFDKGK
jgi:hypothetical protein